MRGPGACTLWLPVFLLSMLLRPALANDPCTAGLPEIEAALRTSALDAHTAAQVESLRRALAAATQAGDVPGCQAAIAQLRDILHLNH
jgi:hypothetical protein